MRQRRQRNLGDGMETRRRIGRTVRQGGMRRVVAAVTAGIGLTTALASSAFSAGFEIPGNSTAAVGRGTAFAVSADDGTAVAYNPGALSRQKGTRLQWSQQALWAHETFTRGPSAYKQGNVSGTDPAYARQPSENQTPLFPLGAFLVASSDFGLEDWTFAIAGYGPSAIGNKEFDVMGGQRYMLTKLDALMAYASAAVAWGKKDRFGIGATLQYAAMPKTHLSLVVDGATGGAANPYYAGNDVVATIKLKDMAAFSAIVGGWLRLSERLEIAFSSRVMPVEFNATGDLSLANDKAGAGAEFKAEKIVVSNSTSAMTMKIAPTATLGARYRGLDATGAEKWDAEVNVVWEGWSVIDAYDVKNGGMINLFAAQPSPDVTIQKRWRNTWSVRAGGSAEVAKGLKVSLGGYWEQGAVPQNYEHLDFPSFDRLGVGTGVRWQGENLQLGLSYAHVFQETREVSELYGKVFQERPLAPCTDTANCAGLSPVPVNNGTFETGYDQLSATVGYKF